jgi:hypothetical protein
MVRFLRAVALTVGFWSAFATLGLTQNPNVTLTGTLQGPNGLPAANQLISLTPSQMMFVAGLGSNGCDGNIIAINGVSLICGDLINFNNTTPVAPTNGINVTWATSKSGTTDSVSAAIVGDGNSAHALCGNGVFGTCTGGTFPGSPLVGDILRYNVNGDSAWDAVNYAQIFQGVYPALGGAAVVVVGPLSSGSATQSNAHADVLATATLGPGETYSGTGTASLNTLIGVKTGENGNNSMGPITAFYRYSVRLSLGETTNSRFWIGLGDWTSSGGTGNNGTAIFGTTAYAADSPNKSTIGFRYSSGTDTNWQAVVATAGGSQTTVDTGVAADTAVHLFEIAPNAAGTSLFFLIDRTVVATISTNIPPVGNGGNSVMTLFWTGDNKNTNNAISATFYSMQMSLK